MEDLARDKFICTGKNREKMDSDWVYTQLHPLCKAEKSHYYCSTLLSAVTNTPTKYRMIDQITSSWRQCFIFFPTKVTMYNETLRQCPYGGHAGLSVCKDARTSRTQVPSLHYEKRLVLQHTMTVSRSSASSSPSKRRTGPRRDAFERLLLLQENIVNSSTL